jgi:hypothetical protein
MERRYGGVDEEHAVLGILDGLDALDRPYAISCNTLPVPVIERDREFSVLFEHVTRHIREVSDCPN